MEFYQRLLIILIPMTVILVLIRVISFKKSKQSKDTIESENNEEQGDININREVVKNRRELRLPFFYRMVALVVSIFSACCGVSILIFDFEEWPYSILFFIVVMIPFLIMFVCWSLWKVEIFKDGFLYRDFVGKKREYKFKDLEYRTHPKGLKWYFYKDGKKVFCMPYYIKNGNSLEKAYRKWISKNKKT